MNRHRPGPRCCFQSVCLIWASIFCFAAMPVHAQQDSEGSGEEATQEKQEKPEEPEEARPAVQPELDAATDRPPKIQLPDTRTAGIRQQIQALRTSLDQRLVAVESTRTRLTYAESLLNRLNDEFESFELRLEKAGLNLTGNYASLLKQRLERLQRQGIAEDLIGDIENRLSTAREEQLRLEEFEAIINTGDDARDQLRSQRASLIRQLHKAVTEHIRVLNEYFSTVSTLQERIEAYQVLLQQRLFWLPSAPVVSADTLLELVRAANWLASQLRLDPLREAIGESVQERGGRLVFLITLLALLLIKRRAIKRKLNANSQYVGNVGHDRVEFTLYALANSFLLALPGVLVFAIAALFLIGGNDFFAALSEGLATAALVTLLLTLIHNVARQGGLGDRHFKWRIDSLRALRRELPFLLAVIIPITVIMPTTTIPGGSEFEDSLGRLLFTTVSIALSTFAHRIMNTVRADRPQSKRLFLLHILAVATPLVLVVASLLGYHYTALKLERNLFISVCWVAFNAMLFYVGLRTLSVRERRLTLVRLRERREAERKIAETKEAAESSGEGVPQILDMPAMDLKDINQQSTALLRILVSALVITGLWLLWAGLIPALQMFDNITLWTIATDLEGGDPLPITLGDLMLALLVGVGTVLAVRNLPGTMEVMVLSRMKLEPGTGYAITTLTTYTLVLIGVVVFLGVIGVQWSKLQWLVAALGVGLGFGLQEIVANFVSGIILLFERPIRVGDTVTIDGITGTVSRIRIRATTLVDWDRKEQIIPNKTFVTQDLTNWTLSDSITRVIVSVSVAYGSDMEQVQELLTEVAHNNERVVDDPAPAVFCVGLGDSGIDFELRVFVKDPLDYMPLSHEINAAVTRALQEAGIEIPFPQRDIHVRSMADT